MIKSNSVWGVLVACGKSEQLAPEVDTAFLQLGDRPVLTYALQAMERCPEIDGIVVVTAKERMESVVGMVRLYAVPKLKKVVAGTIQKSSSVKAALSALSDESASLYVIHEASQPCVTPESLSETIKSARRYGVAAAARKMDVPVAVVPKGLKATKLLDANTGWVLEMPVAIKREPLERMLGVGAGRKGVSLDDHAFFAKLYKDAYMVQLTHGNTRVRSTHDLHVAAAELHT
jgi:2-C-methyl-D-erythritol 4-phosphate cytidylyltransferase